jgi:cell division protein FtsB
LFNLGKGRGKKLETENKELKEENKKINNELKELKKGNNMVKYVLHLLSFLN